MKDIHKALKVRQGVTIDLEESLRKAVEKYGARKVLKAFYFQVHSAYYGMLMLEKTHEDVPDTFKLLTYLFKNWDVLLPKAEKFHTDLLDKADRKIRDAR